jgi:hypothetical protein
MCFYNLTVPVSAELRSYAYDEADPAADWIYTIYNYKGYYDPGAYVGFNVGGADHNIFASLRFPLAEYEQVVAATLRLDCQPTGSGWTSDHLILENFADLYESENRTILYEIDNLGWLTEVPSGQVSLDLTNVAGNDLLYQLRDGRLDFWQRDDLMITRAYLDIEVVPEPATLLLLGLGGLVLRKKNQ